MAEKAKTKRGVVISSNKMPKTVVVRVDRRERHPEYKKIVRRFTKLYVHDPEEICKEGDTVVVKATRPLSKMKRWEVVEVVPVG